MAWVVGVVIGVLAVVVDRWLMCVALLMVCVYVCDFVDGLMVCVCVCVWLCVCGDGFG